MKLGLEPRIGGLVPPKAPVGLDPIWALLILGLTCGAAIVYAVPKGLVAVEISEPAV